MMKLYALSNQTLSFPCLPLRSTLPARHMVNEPHAFHRFVSIGGKPTLPHLPVKGRYSEAWLKKQKIVTCYGLCVV